MKKKVIFISVVAFAAFLGWCMNSNECKKSATDSLMLASVEALSRSEGTGNTGPREQKKCKGGSHKMVCQCMNSHECTDSECY